jgi:hypothetical protein
VIRAIWRRYWIQPVRLAQGRLRWIYSRHRMRPGSRGPASTNGRAIWGPAGAKGGRGRRGTVIDLATHVMHVPWALLQHSVHTNRPGSYCVRALFGPGQMVAFEQRLSPGPRLRGRDEAASALRAEQVDRTASPPIWCAPIWCADKAVGEGIGAANWGPRFAWEADILPAELLPLGAERVIADRAMLLLQAATTRLTATRSPRTTHGGRGV